MIDLAATNHVSYGLYVVCAGDNTKGNGYISNTFFQVTSSPVQFATCCNKDNFTAQLIEEKQAFSVSVLHEETPTELFSHFGYQSGKGINKLAGREVSYGQTGVPILSGPIIAWMECKVVKSFDVGSHWLFIGELVNSEVVDNTVDPMTYLFYKRVKKGRAPKNAPTYIEPDSQNDDKFDQPKYKCLICGFIYDDAKEDIPFKDLPNDWKCPLCGAEKEDFTKL